MLKTLSFIVLFAICFSVQAFAIEKDILEDKFAASVRPEQEAVAPLQKLDDFNYFYTMDLHLGYDNNVDLDPARNEDGFLQASVNADISYEKFDGLTLIGGLDFFNVSYRKYVESSLVNLNPYMGFDWELAPNFIWKNRVALDWFLYPKDSNSTYLAGELSSYLRQLINEFFYHEFGYEFIYRWYGDNKVLLQNRLRGTDERMNARNKIRHNIVANFDNFTASLANEFYINDSNYDYQDYYDYWVYRIRPSITYYLSDEFYVNASFTYRYTDYKNRNNSEDSNKRVHDNTYIATASVYFDLTEEFTMGITYSYRENRSNDPIQKYSGSTVSAGVYYTY